MASQGIAGINAYYDCCDEIVRKEGEIKDAERANKEKEKLAFLEKGSKLIQLIEVNKNSLERLKKKEGWLKSLMASQGIAGINAYYDCCDEIVRKEGEIKDAERALSVMLK